jgi:pilus assembly protein CpaF
VPPVASEGEPNFVLRRVMTSSPLTWENLFEYGSINPDARDLLASAIRAGLNIAVAGGTGSGKTTYCNLLVELIRPTSVSS